MATSEAIHGAASGGVSRPKGLHIALWVVQAMLAVAFGMAGSMKATKPIADLAQQMVWAGDVPAALVRFIGVSEFAAALGLVLPAATRIQPRLTALAAAGIVLVMVLASLFHLSRGEAGALPVNFVFAGLAAFVAWGRARKAPIAPRSNV
jgi:uncharacterized membrane protein YphA (DoxX/SURF4 family)